MRHQPHPDPGSATRDRQRELIPTRRSGSAECIDLVVLLDVRNGESLAYNFDFENLRLGAIERALSTAGFPSRHTTFTDAPAVVGAARRPLVVLDAYFRAADEVVTALRAVRKANPYAEIACFGRAAATLARLQGELELVDHVYSGDEVASVLAAIGAQHDSWDRVTPVRRGILHVPEKRVFDVEATRGCAHSCTFCAVDADHRASRPQVWRARPPEDVVAEIVDTRRSTGMNRVQFVDDNLLGSPRDAEGWASALSKGLVEQASGTAFSFYGRLDGLLLRCLGRMVEAGLVQVHAGVESGSDTVLRRLRKGLTTAQMEKALSALDSHGVELIASLIVFEARTTPGELVESLDWLMDWGMARYFSLSTAIPFPGTRLRSEYESAGIPIDVDRGRLGFPTAVRFPDPRVQEIFDIAKERELTADFDVEWHMRKRFAYEEMLGSIDDPRPTWLADLTEFRLRQMVEIRDHAATFE